NHAPSDRMVGTGKVGDQPGRMGADRVQDRKLTLATETNLAQQDAPKSTRRDFLCVATGAVATVGVAAAVWPLIDQLNPDASVLALASIEFDLAGIEEGQSVTIQWRGLPVFVRHRTAAEIELARAVPMNELKDPARAEA